MNKDKLKESLKQLKENTKKRNFKQSIDLIVALKNLDQKKPDHQIDFFAALHFTTGKNKKICVFAGPEIKDEAGKVCDMTILQADFPKYTDKKKAKALADDYDFFIAQANIMGKVAGAFGKVLGPRGKMPNPKAGCVVPPKANLKPLYDRLQKTIRVTAKTQLQVQCLVGKEDSPDNEILDNIETLHKQLVNHLPNHEANIKGIYLKMTMSKPVKVE